MGTYNGMRIIRLRNPELLIENSQILVRGAWGMVLPEGAVALFEEEYSFRKPNPIPHIEYNGHEYKWCVGCKKWLRLWEFYKHQKKSDGYSGRCVDCAVRLTKAWYQKKKTREPRQAGKV